MDAHACSFTDCIILIIAVEKEERVISLGLNYKIKPQVSPFLNLKPLRGAKSRIPIESSDSFALLISYLK